MRMKDRQNHGRGDVQRGQPPGLPQEPDGAAQLSLWLLAKAEPLKPNLEPIRKPGSAGFQPA